jgi:hypothetical protein
MLDACYNHGVKILIGTAGGAGSDKHVDALHEIIRDMAAKRKYEFRVATIKSSVSRAVIHQKFKQGRISPCGPVPPLEEEEIDLAEEVVAQMGPEPFVKALRGDPDIIIVSVTFKWGACHARETAEHAKQGGRAYDPAPFIAFCLHRLGEAAHPVAWHMGKIVR